MIPQRTSLHQRCRAVLGPLRHNGHGIRTKSASPPCPPEQLSHQRAYHGGQQCRFRLELMQSIRVARIGRCTPWPKDAIQSPDVVLGGQIVGQSHAESRNHARSIPDLTGRRLPSCPDRVMEPETRHRRSRLCRLRSKRSHPCCTPRRTSERLPGPGTRLVPNPTRPTIGPGPSDRC